MGRQWPCPHHLVLGILPELVRVAGLHRVRASVHAATASRVALQRPFRPLWGPCVPKPSVFVLLWHGM